MHKLQRGEGWERDRQRDWEREGLGGTMGDAYLDPKPTGEMTDYRNKTEVFWSYNSYKSKTLTELSRRKRNIQSLTDRQGFLSTQQDCGKL